VTVVFHDPPFELLTSVVFILMSDPSPANDRMQTC